MGRAVFPPCCFSVQFSSSVLSDSLRPHGLQYTRLPCPSPTPGAYSNSCPLSQWCHPTISSSVVVDLIPNYIGGSEDNGNLLQNTPCMHCCTQCPRPCSRPPLTHTSARDSWRLTGKSGSVSCGVMAPFSWVLHCRQILYQPSYQGSPLTSRSQVHTHTQKS